jgi:predicted lipid-binding transport protein (Tim44 family)
MSANRLATLLGALILLSLILYLATAFRRRKKDAVPAKSAKAKVQPKYSPDEKLDELPSAHADEPLAIKETAVAPPSEAQAAAAGATHNQPWVLTKPTIVSPKVDGEEKRTVSEHSTDQEEREVFEL